MISEPPRNPSAAPSVVLPYPSWEIGNEQLEQFPDQSIRQWNWGNGEGCGQIEERFEREVTRTLQGSEITKDGTEDNPAYLIKQDDGDKVLKRGSELKAAN